MLAEVRGDIADAQLLLRQTGRLGVLVGHSLLHLRVFLRRQVAFPDALLPVIPHEEVLAVVVSLFLLGLSGFSQSQELLARPLGVSRQVQSVREPAPRLGHDIAKGTVVVILRLQSRLLLAALCHQILEAGNGFVQDELLCPDAPLHQTPPEVPGTGLEDFFYQILGFFCFSRI